MNIDLTKLTSAAAVAQENMHSEHVPGLAMAFIKNGELVMSQCLGIAGHGARHTRIERNLF